jgi:hypothetical protein
MIRGAQNVLSPLSLPLLLLLIIPPFLHPFFLKITNCIFLMDE